MKCALAKGCGVEACPQESLKFAPWEAVLIENYEDVNTVLATCTVTKI